MSTASDSDPAHRLVELFPVVGRAFSRWVQSMIETSSVSPARMRLLGALHCKGPQIMCGLSDLLEVSPRNVTTLVDGLESEGLVRRVPHPTDRRATIVELTARGFEEGSLLLASYQETVASLYRDLPEADQHELVRLLQALLDSLRQRGQGC
jgi:DNA-binding MarR family transcriptional regulator